MNSNIKILVVSDDVSTKESIEKILKITKYDTTSIGNAEEALIYLKKNTVDVIITDIIMTSLDSRFKLTYGIKKKYDTRVIVITDYSASYSYEEIISKDASDFIFKPVRFKEILLRLKKVLKERKLSFDRIKMIDKLKMLTITDDLTKLYNSRYFYNQLEREINRFNKFKHPLSLLLLDIDFFKIFNDSYGHPEGDTILVRLGQIIHSCLRSVDSGYRYGGEEFAIILPETQQEEAMIVAERIRTTISYEIFEPKPGEVVAITVSIGITQYNSGEDITTFVDRADRAMYKSKIDGRNNISIISSNDS